MSMITTSRIEYVADQLCQLADSLRDAGQGFTGLQLSLFAGDLRGIVQNQPKWPKVLGYTTKAQLDEAGVTYDTALPQEIWADICNVTGQNPCGDVVYAYTHDGSIFGGLVATSMEGALILSGYLQGEKVSP
jgi:hypothetical protein